MMKKKPMAKTIKKMNYGGTATKKMMMNYGGKATKKMKMGMGGAAAKKKMK